MENKLKFILAEKKCSEPNQVVSKFMRFLTHPILVGFDYQDVTSRYDGDHFSKMVPYKCHTKKPDKPVYMHSFINKVDELFQLSDESKLCQVQNIRSPALLLTINNDSDDCYLTTHIVCMNILIVKDGCIKMKYDL